MRILFLKLKRRSKPSKAFKKALWSELELELPKQQTAFISVYWGRFVAVPALVMVLLITTGTGVYAYSSPEVDGDDSLFVVKTSIESVEMMFHRSDADLYDFHGRMLDRRLDEAERRYEAGELSDHHMELIELRLSLMTALDENTPELPEEFELSDDLLAELEIILQVENEEEQDERDRLHHQFERMRNILHGSGVQYDEARGENELEEGIELDLPRHELRQLESFR
jgi:hypothetical protein